MKATPGSLLRTSYVAGLGILLSLFAAVTANLFMAGIVWVNASNPEL